MDNKEFDEFEDCEEVVYDMGKIKRVVITGSIAVLCILSLGSVELTALQLIR